jgi:hypothetical protein
VPAISEHETFTNGGASGLPSPVSFREWQGDVACTIGGLGGWYRQLTGIERYPNSELRSVAGTVPVEPGRVYCVVAGRKGAIDFLYVDGVLIVQLTDTAARRRAVSHIALATWDGHVRFLRAAIYRIP